MSAETIIVQIDPTQLALQKDNQYSLYVAKKVNGAFTVIWQSKGPIATAGHPSYEFNNTFQIAVPEYQVNYATVTEVDGSVTFSAAGQPVAMYTGQSVVLDQNGIFGTPTNTGTAGNLTIENSLMDNPNAMLSDSAGNPIYVDTVSGMDKGESVITPIDTYQVWFASFQKTGTVIVQNFSEFATVEFAGGATTQTISYNVNGTWQQGPLPSSTYALDASAQVADVSLTVIAALSAALTTVAATYVLNNLVSKFSSGLKPSSIKVSRGSASIEITFQSEPQASLQLDKYESAVNQALTALKNAPKSPFAGETWTLSEPNLCASF